MSFKLDPDHTHEELVAHFADERDSGFSAASCGHCRKTINLTCLSYQMGWGCPGCGGFNNGHFSGGFFIPHEQPDFGPTRAQIGAAAEEARRPETAALLRLPEHLRTCVIARVEDLRPEGERSPEYKKGLYVVAPKDFPHNCTLTVSVSGGCYATRDADDTPDMYLTHAARSPEAAALLHHQGGPRPTPAPPSVLKVTPRTREVILGGGTASDVLAAGGAGRSRPRGDRTPRAVATCSCGRRSPCAFVVPEDGSHLGSYEALTAGWVFSADPGKPVGWNCGGGEGHYQTDWTEHDGGLPRKEAVRQPRSQPPDETFGPEVATLLHLAGDAQTPRETTGPRALGVHQGVGSGIQALQLSLAVAAARQGLRTLIVYRRAERDDLEHHRAHALGLDESAPVGLLLPGDELAPRAAGGQVLLTSAAALDALLGAAEPPAADAFDIIIIGQGFTFRQEETRRRLGGHFARARLLLLWTSIAPAFVPAGEAKTTGRITVFDATLLAPTLPRDLRRLPGLKEWGGKREEWRERLPKEYLETPPRTSCAFDFSHLLSPDLPVTRVNPYDELPPLDALKTARVLLVTPAVGELADALNKMLETSPAERGMYILVPRDFPDECEVAVSLLGYYASAEVGGARHRFRVWPSPTIATAEEAYEHARTECRLIPEAIGSVETPSEPFSDRLFVFDESLLLPGPLDLGGPRTETRVWQAGDDPAKPEGSFRCRACCTTWEGSQLILSPYHTQTTWLCGDACCGALVDKCS